MCRTAKNTFNKSIGRSARCGKTELIRLRCSRQLMARFQQVHAFFYSDFRWIPERRMRKISGNQFLFQRVMCTCQKGIFRIFRRGFLYSPADNGFHGLPAFSHLYGMGQSWKSQFMYLNPWIFFMNQMLMAMGGNGSRCRQYSHFFHSV